MSHSNTDPELAVDTSHIDEKIGRLYRKPDTILPETLNYTQTKQLIQEGKLFPSTTNVIGVRSAGVLIPWASYTVAKAMVDWIVGNPEKAINRIQKNPQGATIFFKEAPIRTRDTAGLQGTKIHTACELISKGETIDHLNLTEYEQTAVDKWKQWVDTFQPEFLHQEITSFGATTEGLQYAGTSDFIAKINNETVLGDYKCVVDDTKILMADGSQKPAINITEGDLVVAWSKEKGLHAAPVSFAGDNGYHPTITITTSMGQKLTTTLNHPYWSSQRGKNLGWVKAEDLKIGDELYSAIGWNYAPTRETTPWPYGRNLSPYLLGVLWSLRNYGTEDWRSQHLITLPKISRPGLRQELHEIGFHFNKAGQMNTRKGLAKIARKNKLTVDEVLDLFDMEELPSFVFNQNTSVPGFLTGVQEVFVNKEIYSEEIFIVFRRAQALRTLQQYLMNHGQPATIHKDPKSGIEYLKTPFESKETIYGYGPSATRITSIESSSDPAHTVALEVKDSHTHITNGLITHNTNRSGLHSEVALQLAANKNATHMTVDNKTLTPMIKIDKTIGVHISNRQVTTSVVDTSDNVWHIFEALREVWDFHVFDEYTAGSGNVIQRTVTKPEEL